MLVSTGGAELGVGAVVATAVVGAGAVVVVVGNVDDAAVVATTVVVLAAISVGDGADAIVVVPPLSPPPDPHAARPAAEMEMMILVRRCMVRSCASHTELSLNRFSRRRPSGSYQFDLRACLGEVAPGRR